MRRPEPDGPDTLARARDARRRATPAESKLWSAIRSRQLDRAKFRRQVWLGPFIADFFCPEARLIVEVDGGTHAHQIEYDKRRTKWLSTEGFRVVRVTNSDVMHNLDGVLRHISAALPSPSQP